MLIVDDVADNRDLYEVSLRTFGFVVTTAERAEEGLAIAFEKPPDIIVMDHMLPGLDGCEATGILKKDPRTAHIPVIMVTGHSVLHIEELARNCGADDFRTKPLTPTDLARAIDALLDARKARST